LANGVEPRLLQVRRELPHAPADRVLEPALSLSTLKIINGAGHVPIMTRPDDVAREIQSFYQDQVM
jgi:pimeloyl-ACP methyl ester carboxylesterase